MKPTLTSYFAGFIVSVALTLAAFFVVDKPLAFHVPHPWIIPVILALAGVQLLVQLIYFMHVGTSAGSRWKLPLLISTIGIILIIVIGSLWIMNHLNYNMMASPSEMNAYIQSQDGL